MRKSLFWATVIVMLCVVSGFANVPVNKLQKQVDWLLPLHIDRTYTPIKKGEILTLGWETVNIDALVQRNINKNDLKILYYDDNLKKWRAVPQILVEYPNEGSEVGNMIWDYGPYVGHDAIYFESQKDIKPLTVCDQYVLVAIKNNQKKRNYVGTPQKLSASLLFRMADSGSCSNEGWCVERTYKSNCKILPANTNAYHPHPVSVEYVGRNFKSNAKVLSRPIPVNSGDKVEWRVIYQIKKFPTITMKDLPGEKLIKRPGDVEGLLPRIIWNIKFKDKAGNIIKKAPTYWRRDGSTNNNPIEVIGSFTVPRNACTYQHVFYVGGKGEIKFDVLDILVYRQVSPKARDYSICDGGKIFFPQIEIRRSSDGVFEVNKGITVWLSPKLNKLSEEKKKILLDGLRNYQPVISKSNSVKLRISLLDENLQLPFEIINNQKLKERVRHLPAEGYVLSISSTGASVWARDRRGAFYAVQELGERLKLGNGKVDSAIIIDWPELPLRMVQHHLTWRALKKPKEYYTKWIPRLARMRINAITFDVRRDWYNLNNSKILKQWKWTFELCRKWNITPVPMGYNFRNSMPIYDAIWLTPGKWVEKEPYILHGQKPTPLRPKCDAFRFRPLRKSSNLVPDKNGKYPVIPMIYMDNPVIATSADGKRKYEFKKDFVIEGKVKWGGDRLPFIYLTLEKPFTIRRTKHSRIPDGAKILLSYNYLYRVRGWHNETYSTCISSWYAQKITGEAIKNTIKKLHPDIIHINQDEVVGIGRDGRDKLRMEKNHLTPGQLFADLLNSLKGAARSAGYKKPLHVWDDGLTLKHSGWMLNYNGPYYTEDAINYISPKDFIIDVWQYGSTTQNVADDFLKRGFSIVGASSENIPGIIAWSHYLATKKLEYPKRIRGIYMTIWRLAETTSFRSKIHFARLSWNPGPWVQYDNGKVYVYDIYYEPTKIKINGKYAELIPAKSLPISCRWLAWQCGYTYFAKIPENISSEYLTVEATDKAGYKSRNIVVRTDDLKEADTERRP